MHVGAMFIGLAVIAIGILLLLDRLDVLKGGLGKYWPVLIIALGIAMVLSRWRRRW